MTSHSKRLVSSYSRSMTVRLPSELLEAVDRYADHEFCRRSVAVRQLLDKAVGSLKGPDSELDVRFMVRRFRAAKVGGIRRAV
jgi:hypothetical protein